MINRRDRTILRVYFSSPEVWDLLQRVIGSGSINKVCSWFPEYEYEAHITFPSSKKAESIVEDLKEALPAFGITRFDIYRGDVQDRKFITFKTD
jgi:hypothetical protein